MATLAPFLRPPSGRVPSGLRTSVPFVTALTPSQKGGVAELKIAAAAAGLGIDVYRPVTDGTRCDLIFGTADRLLRIQCKSARLRGAVLRARLATNRHTPSGYRSTTYTRDEIDAFAIYSPDLDLVYLLPIGEFAGQTYVYLRLAPTLNQQRVRCRMADQYLLKGL